MGSLREMKFTSDIKRYLGMVLAAGGAAIMGYLTYIHYANARSFCDISEKVSCDIVTTSIYSEIFGVPVSVLGLLYFAVTLFIMIRLPAARAFRAVFFLTAFAIAPSLYLTLAEILLIKSFCVLCESSKLLMVGLLAVSWSAIYQTKGLLRLTAPLVIAGLVAAGVTYFIQTGTVVKADYSWLAVHLKAEGWVYYRSYTCSNCKRQEKILGDAYQMLNKVECHPKGPNGQPELCLAKNITKTPTWLLEKDGRETKRLEGLQSIQQLSAESGFAEQNN